MMVLQVSLAGDAWGGHNVADSAEARARRRCLGLADLAEGRNRGGGEVSMPQVGQRAR